MAYTKAGMRAVNKYMKKNYDSFLVRVPKGRKADVEACAKVQGESVNGMVNRLLRTETKLSEEEWKKASDEP